MCTENGMKGTCTNIKRNNLKFGKSAIWIGASLLLLGTLCLIAKIALGESVDSGGFLQESFFLLPLAFTFFACGLTVFTVTGIKNAALIFSRNAGEEKRHSLLILCISGAVILAGIAVLIILKAANG